MHADAIACLGRGEAISVDVGQVDVGGPSHVSFLADATIHTRPSGCRNWKNDDQQISLPARAHGIYFGTSSRILKPSLIIEKKSLSQISSRAVAMVRHQDAQGPKKWIGP